MAPDVYLMAFACEPDRGSEPGVGFVFARAAARLARERGHRVVLVTRPHRLDEIRAALGADADELTILPVALPRAVVAATGRARVRLAYVLWQAKAVLAVRAQLRRSARPAVVHHVTFATEALPTFESLLRRRAGLVFGPAGSATVTGAGLSIRLRRAIRARIAGANLAHADLLVAQNEDVAASWQRFRAPVVVEANIVIEPFRGSRLNPAWDAATAGFQIERKRFDLALEAFAASGATGRLLMIGDGPEHQRLRARAHELGIADRTDFVGGVSQNEVVLLLSRSRVLLHPSRQEGAGWVIGEAQSVGTLPIVFSGGGADSTVRAAGIGSVVDPDEPNGLAGALRSALDLPRPPISDRWSADRLTALLDGWYATAAAGRPERVL